MALFHACPICRSRIPHFVPLPRYYVDKAVEHGFPYGLHEFETINHQAYSCPNCHSTDRDRLFALFLTPVFQRLNQAQPVRFLDIAPGRALTFWLKSHPHVFYRSCDMHLPEADDKADIHNLPYADESFDFVLCSHVLEHVEDPVRATAEIRRVLKQDSVAILMAPICLSIEHTYENPEVTTPEGRWAHFGQDDHVRLFSRSGFIDVIQRAGLGVQRIPVTDFLTPEVCETYGIGSNSILYLGVKQQAVQQAPEPERNVA
ncbi:SAM-dependent methyltransferase [Rhizobium binae]|uniref:SAM-dependent methyltransferase n=1 Tax=Rhizobium binae TaxID=1138190 RepID=A0ABV2MM52_9HYPH|nr:class I SAM-dependent methyltransferase [Rhizobium binae]MBX4993754.1 methyltransferase domain-containing protein [Rhizobium binae]NKL46819.1 methyltransferase domain-containing protein [Rhizobium leguminosarum bv. viciae]QSY83357.1 methyltransferase domain-containing protein [Rhizobium binae]